VPVLSLPPIAAGDVFQWTGTYASLIDLDGPDDDLSFVLAAAVGLVMLVRTHDSPDLKNPVPIVAGVSFTARIRRAPASDPNTQFAPVFKSGAVIVTGSATIAPSSYAGFGPGSGPGWSFDTDPETGLPWTFAAALASQIGLVDSTDTEFPHTIRCTTMRKLIDCSFGLGPNAVRGDFHG
jgi:hypothetical protein